MMKRFLSLATVVAIAATPACDRDADRDDVIDRDTAIITGVDTVDRPMEMPTTDTVVETTTVDTIEGGIDTTATPRP
jgi:hypothetical protein